MIDIVSLFREQGIQPTPHRMAVVEYILNTKTHPTAEQVLEYVRGQCPMISRATVCNTLNFLSDKGLIKTQLLREGMFVFDANVGRHHHLIDEETGDIHDIPWDALEVKGEQYLDDFQVREFRVVMRGKRVRK